MSREVVDVRATLNSCPVDLAPVADGPMECAAMTLRMGTTDTTVASVYIRPQKPWHAAALCQLCANLGSDAVLCGDFNAHHPAWGSHGATRRVREPLDAAITSGLHVANTGSTTFVRPCRHRGTVQQSCIDLTLVMQG
ncbi:uncharacterized protein LOC144143377 [Haemaphysalis longicornis]